MQDIATDIEEYLSILASRLRILTILKDVELQLIERLQHFPYYALQLDETTDVSSNAVLMVYVICIYRFWIGRNERRILYTLTLQAFTTSHEIFQSINWKVKL